jgi:hypothetical protein
MTALAMTALVSLAAWSLLALAMQRHQRDLIGRTFAAGQARRLRMAGAMLLAVSPGPTFWHWGVASGLPIWLATLSLAAVAAVMIIIVRARALQRASGDQQKGG